MKPKDAYHPVIQDAAEQLAARKIARRDFLRTATALGLSATSAYALAAATAGATTQSTTTETATKTPQRGGVLKVAMEVQRMDDPATFSWGQMANQARHILEYLTITRADNTTHPMLAERWEASDDLKTWTFYLRQGVKWHNGDEFNADDVIYTIKRWTDPAIGSSNTGLASIAAMLESVETGELNDDGTPQRQKRLRADALERVDDYTVRFHLSQPVLTVAEDLHNYPTAIVHREFTPPLSDNPNGTGPYTLSELTVGDRCILVRAPDHEYWGEGAYLDEIHYYHFDAANQLTALAGGDVDAIYSFGSAELAFAQAIEGQIITAQSARTVCCRMRTDTPPFDNPKVREAIVRSIDNQAINDLLLSSTEHTGWNHHVAPVHPEYFALPPLSRDVERARALLTEAGYPDGLELTIDVGNTNGIHEQTICEAMRDQMRDAGIQLNINVIPASKYWEIWQQTPFGATSWAHRPLGTMALGQAYRSDSTWNETRYSNPKFDAALDEAESLLSVTERQKAMEKVERILQSDHVMIQPSFDLIYTMTSNRVHNYPAHPTQFHHFLDTWIEA